MKETKGAIKFPHCACARLSPAGAAQSAKGGFFSETSIHFLDLKKKNIPNNYPELEI